MNGNNVLLDVQGVTLVREGRTILRDVHLQVLPGEIHALVGVNGSGKSSLAYAIMGCAAYRPDAGEIVFAGRVINDLPIYERARLGLTLAWQEPARFDGLPIGDYLTLGRPAMTREELWEALQAVALAPEAYLPRALDRTLSGGERKRIELAAVYAMRPRLAILDEPDSGVDVLSFGDVQHLVRCMARMGCAVLLITHRREMAAIADRASVMHAGQIVRSGSPKAEGA
ncbi:MAG: ATP-binding cassette domain-containing protein [Roseiflexus sp.]